jgi:hypothetical protein
MIKPWFLTEGKFAPVLIIPSSWGSQLGGYPARISDSYLFSAVFVFQKSYTGNILGIGRNKSRTS